MSRATPLIVLASLAVAAGCSDQPVPTTAPMRPNASLETSPPSTLFSVKVGAPVVLDGFPGSTYNIPTGINALGDASGISISYTQHAVRWPAASKTPMDLGAGNANDINVAGQLTGEYGARAILWTPDGMGGYTLTNISQQLPLAITSSVKSINASGQVVGTYHIAVSDSVYADRCFLWTPDRPNATTGTVTLLPDLGGSFCIANDINSAGYVVGISTIANNQQQHAFLWSPPGSGQPGIQDLTPGGGSSYATSINDAGQVAGQHWTATAGMAAIWSPTPSGSYTVTDLGTFTGTESVALDINDNGFVVGFARRSGSGDADAFFWQNGEFTLLPGVASDNSAVALTPLNGKLVQVVGGSVQAGTAVRTALRWNLTLTGRVK